MIFKNVPKTFRSNALWWDVNVYKIHEIVTFQLTVAAFNFDLNQKNNAAKTTWEIDELWRDFCWTTSLRRCSVLKSVADR